MTCKAPACKHFAIYSVSFNILRPRVAGNTFYECDDSEYCHKHMLEHLEFLMTLVAEDEQISNKKKEQILNAG